MKIILSGASGLIGKRLIAALSGHELFVLVRKPSSQLRPSYVREIVWDARSQGDWARELDGADAVVNLSGEPIAGRRWSAAQKVNLANSRIYSTRAIVDAISRAQFKPKTLVNASAIGIYGPRDASPIDESAQAGQGFLAAVCAQWEKEALKAEKSGARVVLLRTGIVLDPSGGALAKMLPPFCLGLGGPLGSGEQMMSWVHIDDEVAAIRACLENTALKGPVNLTAPHPVTMKEFARALGRALHRPAAAPVPAFVLKIALGEMSEMLLTGQNVVPRKLQDAGFSFRYPDLDGALKDLLKR
jgi:uncharacterized protein (TIGR01777 family)